MRQDIAQLNESTLSAIGMDKATIAAFRQLTKQVGMVVGATTLPEVVESAGQAQATIDALEPLVLALIASHTDSLRTQLAAIEPVQPAVHEDSRLRRRVDELEMQVAALNPAPFVPASLSSAAISCFAAYQSSAQAFVANTYTRVLFQSAQFDDLGEFDATASAFTAAATGTYLFHAGVSGTQGVACNRAIGLFVNGSERIRLQQNSTIQGNNAMSAGSVPVRLTKGDVVALHYFTELADTTNTTAIYTYFGGARIK